MPRSHFSGACEPRVTCFDAHAALTLEDALYGTASARALVARLATSTEVGAPSYLRPAMGVVGATGVLMYWRGMKRKRAAQPYKNQKALPDASSPFKNPKSPSPRDGERVSLRSGLAATVDVEGLDVMETTVAVSQSTITTSDMDQLDRLTDALEPPGAPPRPSSCACTSALVGPPRLRLRAGGVRRRRTPLAGRRRRRCWWRAGRW